jgi:hypothetical protein
LNARIHILSQFLWPDGAPTALYAEQLADSLSANGYPVRLVGGIGSYREALRPRPTTEMTALTHYTGQRESLWSVGLEYFSVRYMFSRYIAESVGSGDIVVVSSAPPNTINLARNIRRKGATAVYWLQDYYPQLLRGLWDYPRSVGSGLTRVWDRSLGAWDHVVKVAGNLSYEGSNAQVIRNWPTVQFSGAVEPIPLTALYAGNFGYCQHLPSFLNVCQKLRDDGYHITVQGDGPGIERMPDWIETRPPLRKEDELIRSYELAEVNIVAAHPNIQGAVFPSKFWNGRASGRKLVFAGFAGRMLQELQTSLEADYSIHITQWNHFLGKLYESKDPERSRPMIRNPE